jgi:hypothetical protein
MLAMAAPYRPAAGATWRLLRRRLAPQRINNAVTGACGGIFTSQLRSPTPLLTRDVKVECWLLLADL